jgi:hypothetical protein
MTTDYNDTIAHPLTSDALIQERVAALIGRACRRQLWFLFLDENDVQLPTIMPVGDPPPLPDATVPALARTIQQIVEAQGACSVILVLERFAGAAFTAADKAWARELSRAFDGIGLPARAVLVSHQRGVRWFAKDDYGYEGDEPAGQSG